ncbi:MAG: helix-turn-helix transcriptional regulator [Acidobacteria bacterium]|nr:helix-turn-helix transcriptional regulator [Acidobacteriota bacterium]
MRHRDYVKERETRDPEFRAARGETAAAFAFRRALIESRLAAKLTQKEMAERLGTKQSAIARWESGAQLPSLATLHRLAVAFGLDFAITPAEPLRVRRHRAA